MRLRWEIETEQICMTTPVKLLYGFKIGSELKLKLFNYESSIVGCRSRWYAF